MAATIGASVGHGMKLGRQLSKTGAGVGEFAFKSFSYGGRIVFIGAVAVGVLLDILTLVNDSIKSIPDVVSDIRMVAGKMTEQMDEVEQLD